MLGSHFRAIHDMNDLDVDMLVNSMLDEVFTIDDVEDEDATQGNRVVTDRRITRRRRTTGRSSRTPGHWDPGQNARAQPSDLRVSG